MSAIKANISEEESMETTERQLLTTGEVATRIRKSRYWVQCNHLRLGIPSHRIGSEYFFVEPELEAWIESRRVTPLTDNDRAASPSSRVSLVKKAS
jgi:hypothetical protein